MKSRISLADGDFIPGFIDKFVYIFIDGSLVEGMVPQGFRTDQNDNDTFDLIMELFVHSPSSKKLLDNFNNEKNFEISYEDRNNDFASTFFDCKIKKDPDFLISAEGIPVVRFKIESFKTKMNYENHLLEANMKGSMGSMQPYKVGEGNYIFPKN